MQPETPSITARGVARTILAPLTYTLLGPVGLEEYLPIAERVIRRALAEKDAHICELELRLRQTRAELRSIGCY